MWGLGAALSISWRCWRAHGLIGWPSAARRFRLARPSATH